VSESTVPAESLNATPKQRLIAPLWHTIVLLVFILGNSYASFYISRRFVATSAGAAGPSVTARMVTYASTIIMEWVLFLYVYFGMRARGETVRNRVNARWNSAGDVWRDIGIGLGLWITLIVVAGVFALPLRHAGNEGSKVVTQLIPHTLIELPIWALLTASAGFCEEFIFRGYLLEQFRRITGSVAAAIVIQALIFGLAHGYQGWAHMAVIVAYGLVFGGAAWWRKSLAPGMVAHGWLDFITGVGLYVAHLKHLV
jgi:uncharacterized protein